MASQKKTSTRPKPPTVKIANAEQAALLLKTVLGSRVLAMIMVNAAGQIVTANDRAQTILDLTPGENASFEVPAWRYIDLDGMPTDAKRLPFCVVMDTGKPVFDRIQAIEWPDGQRKVLRISAEPVRDAEGILNLVIGTLEDITAHHAAETELARRREWLDMTLDAAGMATWSWDIANDRTTYSDNVPAMLGVDEVISTLEGFIQTVHLDDREHVRKVVKDTLDSGRADYFSEHRVLLPDGSIRWVENRGKVYRNAEGRPVLMAGTSVDSTARKEQEEALHATQDRWRTLVQNAPDFIVMVDEKCRITFINQILGPYKMEEVIGQPIHGYYLPQYQEHVREKLELAWRTGEPVDFEGQVPTSPDGEPHWYLSRVGVQKHKGKTVQLIVISRDVNEIHRHAQALAESEGRYRALVELSPIPIVVHSDYRVVLANREAQRCFGATDSEMEDGGGRLLGRSIWDLIHPSYWDYAKERIAEVYKHKKNDRLGESRFVKLNGQVMDVELMAAPTQFRGNPAAQVVFRDVTERKRLEEQLRQASKVESIGRLAGGVAHDFNNLLTSILGFSELATYSLPEGAPTQKHLRRIHDAARRGATLTQQLLAFARKQVIQPRIIHLGSLLRGTLDMLRRLIGEDIDLKTDVDAGLWTVKVDPGQFEQILMNLAVNARDAMPEGGTLTIRALNVTQPDPQHPAAPDMAAGDYVLLSVADTGVGMDQEMLKHIFEPFFTTKPVGKGTGLGLSMCYGIVAQSGGSIWVESEERRGSTFLLYLPRVDAPRPEAEAVADTHPPMGRHERILLVEDDLHIRDLIRDALVKLRYKVITARDGADALAAVEDLGQPIDLLVTDVVMPRMGGKELADRMRTRYPGLKVIYTSGYPQGDLGTRGVLEEDVCFVQKPYTPKQLAVLVREQLAAPPARP